MNVLGECAYCLAVGNGSAVGVVVDSSAIHVEIELIKIMMLL